MEEEDKEEIVSMLNAVSFFGKVTLEEMKEQQQKDPVLKLVYKQVTAGKKLKTSAIAKVKSKAVRKYLLQVNWLTLKKGVLHHLYINNDVVYHQMILPIKYQAQMSSGVKMYSCLMLRKILLEYHVPRCNQLCKKLSTLPNCKG